MIVYKCQGKRAAKGNKMLIRYCLGFDVITCLIDHATAAEHVEKLRSIGAKNIRVYQIACHCEAGIRVIDEDCTTEPCTDCTVGRQYEYIYYPDRVIPF